MPAPGWAPAMTVLPPLLLTLCLLLLVSLLPLLLQELLLCTGRSAECSTAAARHSMLLLLAVGRAVGLACFWLLLPYCHRWALPHALQQLIAAVSGLVGLGLLLGSSACVWVCCCCQAASGREALMYVSISLQSIKCRAAKMTADNCPSPNPPAGARYCPLMGSKPAQGDRHCGTALPDSMEWPHMHAG